MELNKSGGFVKYNITNKIAHLEFYHPKSNSLPANLLNLLAKNISDIGKITSIQAIILKSKGNNAFCAGASFDELINIKDEYEGEKFFSGFAKVINAARKCPKLIIGRIHGKAVGGGVGLAAAVDYCFATKFSSIKLSELSIGIGPFVVGPVIERKIGKSAMTDLSINPSEWKSPIWANQRGLYSEIFESVEEMDKSIFNLLEKLSTYNNEALSEMKKIFWEGTDNWDKLLVERAKISGKLVLSKYTKESIKKIKKRK